MQIFYFNMNHKRHNDPQIWILLQTEKLLDVDE